MCSNKIMLAFIAIKIMTPCVTITINNSKNNRKLDVIYSNKNNNSMCDNKNRMPYITITPCVTIKSDIIYCNKNKYMCNNKNRTPYIAIKTITPCVTIKTMTPCVTIKTGCHI